jgi:ATP adenylyltransferase
MSNHTQQTTTRSRYPVQKGTDRFSSLLSIEPGSRASYDEVLFEVDECVVAPTLGSIVPNWLLIVPRKPFPNLVRWAEGTNADVCTLMSHVLARAGVSSERALWFEHGAAAHGLSLACGVDHAHLHLIVDPPFSFEQFTSNARKAAPICWQLSTKFNPKNVPYDASYLFAASWNCTALALQVECVGSQFFRRVVADLVGQPTAWDYRGYPFVENVWKTINAFGKPSGAQEFTEHSTGPNSGEDASYCDSKLQMVP